MPNIITPKIFADVVNARLGVKLRVTKLATDYTEYTARVEHPDRLKLNSRNAQVEQ